jgi:hypothetical protein
MLDAKFAVYIMRTSSQQQVQNEAKFEAKNRLVINKMIAF